MVTLGFVGCCCSIAELESFQHYAGRPSLISACAFCDACAEGSAIQQIRYYYDIGNRCPHTLNHLAMPMNTTMRVPLACYMYINHKPWI